MAATSMRVLARACHDSGLHVLGRFFTKEAKEEEIKTMKFRVYYRTDAEFRNAHKVNTKNINPEHYHKVGNVPAFDLQELFRRMNCVDGSDFELVGRGKRFEVRSMSVGDIAIDEEGRGYLCNSMGWGQFDGSIFG